MDFEALGTSWHIEAERPLSPLLQQSITVLLAKIELRWSRFRSDSMVSRLAKEGGSCALNESERQLFSFYADLYRATEGLLTPLVGNLLTQAGYDAEYSFRSQSSIEPAQSWDKALALEGDRLSVTQGALIDVGAAGKGWAVDQVASLIVQEQEVFLIDAGGDMYGQGAGWVIGLEHPLLNANVIGAYQLVKGSICGSAANRRVWGNWHHIVNPKMAKSVDNVLASWAMADSAMIADGLATALFLVEPQQLNGWTFDYVVMKQDTLSFSSSKEIELFI